MRLRHVLPVLALLVAVLDAVSRALGEPPPLAAGTAFWSGDLLNGNVHKVRIYDQAERG